ncbi:helix-turn-helix domain-containing protein [Streptomyces sp. NPDC058954]|uniref:helix-turn-helix domain-containing protein n=1 Tax=Streptomyces sp. NPDC058954 TaxID=3346677 RepID=UPI00368ECB2A
MSDSRTQRELGLLLRNHRRRAGLTQRHLADLATVSVRAIRNLEQGKVRWPRLHTVRLLADALRLGAREREALLDAARSRPHGVHPDAVRTAPGASGPWSLPGPLIGRGTELDALTELLRPPGRRLVSVVGIGGVGKSYLAAEAVRRTAADGTGVLWIPCGEAVPSAEFTARSFPAVPLVLVLDDTEADFDGNGRLTDLMQSHPGLRILRTAPGPCGIPGEQVLRLAPLPVPDPGAEADVARLAEVPSVRLLCSHIRAIDPRFELGGADAATVAELCRRLDGLPRALQFAGGWTLVRSLRELLADVERSPFGLTAPPMTTDAPTRDPVVRLRRTLGRLSPSCASFLATVARAGGSWSIEEAALTAETSGADAAVIVFTLITYGLVRSEAAGDGEPRFSVLHHVRHLYADARREPRERGLKVGSARATATP